MKNRNHFIIFSVVIIILIIVGFVSVIVTADNNIKKESEAKKNDNSIRKNIKPKNNKIKILIDPGHNAATKGSVGWLGYEYYMTLRLAKQLTGILDEDNRFEYFLSRDGDYYSSPIKEYMTNNYQKLLGIYETKIRKDSKLENLTRYQTIELYAIRNYAIDNNYDLLLKENEENYKKLIIEVKKLGLKNSTFRNATGIPHPEHLMSAKDLALLSQRIINDYPENYKIYSQKEFSYNGIKQGNRNPLLYSLEGADGLKTGHTGVNPRDTVEDTLQNRGLDVSDCRNILKSAGYEYIAKGDSSKEKL